MVVTSCVFSKAWQNLKAELETGKTSWGKIELRDLMYNCLHTAALQTDEQLHISKDND